MENKLESAESKVSKVDEFDQKLKNINKEIADLVAVKANVEAQLVRVTELGQNLKKAFNKIQGEPGGDECRDFEKYDSLQCCPPAPDPGHRLTTSGPDF